MDYLRYTFYKGWHIGLALFHLCWFAEQIGPVQIESQGSKASDASQVCTSIDVSRNTTRPDLLNISPQVA